MVLSNIKLLLFHPENKKSLFFILSLIFLQQNYDCSFKVYYLFFVVVIQLNIENDIQHSLFSHALIKV